MCLVFNGESTHTYLGTIGQSLRGTQLVIRQDLFHIFLKNYVLSWLMAVLPQATFLSLFANSGGHITKFFPWNEHGSDNATQAQGLQTLSTCSSSLPLCPGCTHGGFDPVQSHRTRQKEHCSLQTALFTQTLLYERETNLKVFTSLCWGDFFVTITNS